MAVAVAVAVPCCAMFYVWCAGGAGANGRATLVACNIRRAIGTALEDLRFRRYRR